MKKSFIIRIIVALMFMVITNLIISDLLNIKIFIVVLIQLSGIISFLILPDKD